VADREAYRVEVYARVRRAVQVDGMSIRQKDREFGPVRRRPGRCRGFSMPLGLLAEEVGRAAKLGPQLGIIDQIPAEDGARPKKHRHTAERIRGRFKAEHGLRGGCTIIKDYGREARLRH